MKQREFPIRNKKDTVNLLIPGNRLKTRLFALHLPQINIRRRLSQKHESNHLFELQNEATLCVMKINLTGLTIKTSFANKGPRQRALN